MWTPTTRILIFNIIFHEWKPGLYSSASAPVQMLLKIADKIGKGWRNGLREVSADQGVIIRFVNRACKLS